jgi:hypothetical protein
MAYEMLVGEVPLQGNTAVETLAMQVDESPDRINERLTEPVPEKIEALVMRMLEKDPGRRPQSMAEVEALLIEAQLEARVQTPWDEELTLPPMDPDRATRIARRLSPQARSARLSLVAASSVAVLSVTFAIFFAMRDPIESQAGSAAAEHAPTAPGRQSPAATAGGSGAVAHEPSAPGPTPVAVAPHTAPAATSTPEPVQPIPVPIEDVPAPPAARPPVMGVKRPPVVASRPQRVERPTPSVTPARLPPALPSREDPLEMPAPARDPGKARALVARGQQALIAGRSTQAEKEFREAAEADPENVDALAGRAEAEFENAKYESALRTARAATRKSSRIPKHHVLVGLAAFKLGRFDEALQAYERALRLAPDDRTIRDYIDTTKTRMGAAKPQPQ